METKVSQSPPSERKVGLKEEPHGGRKKCDQTGYRIIFIVDPVEGDQQGIHLVNFDMALLPPEAVVDGALMNFTAIVKRFVNSSAFTASDQGMRYPSVDTA